MISKSSYIQRDFKIQFLINGLDQRVGTGLEYHLRTEIVENSIRSYGGFMK